MSHPLLKTASRLFYALVMVSVAVRIVSACSCPPPKSVLDAYDAADAVLIVRLVSVHNSEASESAAARNFSEATFAVERVYKGNVKAHDKLSFGLVHNIHCPSVFREEDINNEFLFYAQAPKNDKELWTVVNCGRSKAVSLATEDFLYLDNMNKRRGKTRISGKYGNDRNQDLVVAHRRIRIVSDEKAYETFTNEKGFFEIYDVPPGKYRLEPEIPAGMRIDRWFLRLNSSAAAVLKSPNSAQFNLEPKKHVSINLGFEPDNAVAGRLIGPKGEPLVNTCAYLRRPDDNMGLVRGDTRTGCADEKGLYRIESIPPGDYVLVLNQDGLAKGVAPFPRVFYPGTTELAKATTLTVALGQTLQDIDVVVPAMLDTITVEGVLLFSDDQPVTNQYVHFEGIEKAGLLSWNNDETDEQGRFSLKIIKGHQGKLLSKMGVYHGMYRNCPVMDALVKETPQKLAVLSTQQIKIDAEQDLRNVVLRFPVPSCQAKPETPRP